MDIKKYRSNLADNVINQMAEYIEEYGEFCSFSKKDIAKCEEIILGYLSALDGIKKPDNRKIMREVKAVVIALNKLNKKTKYSLIETMEREAIWEIIQSSAVERGLTNPADDITEKWREW